VQMYAVIIYPWVWSSLWLYANQIS